MVRTFAAVDCASTPPTPSTTPTPSSWTTSQFPRPPAPTGELDGEIVTAIDRQTRAVNTVADGQLALQQSLDDIASAAGGQVTIATGESAGWMPFAAGTGIGVGVVAVLGLLVLAGRWVGRGTDVDRARREPAVG